MGTHTHTHAHTHTYSVAYCICITDTHKFTFLDLLVSLHYSSKQTLAHHLGRSTLCDSVTPREPRTHTDTQSHQLFFTRTTTPLCNIWVCLTYVQHKPLSSSYESLHRYTQTRITTNTSSNLAHTLMEFLTPSPSLQQQHPCFGAVCRLAKRWLGAQLFSADVCEDAADLLVAYLFLHPAPMYLHTHTHTLLVSNTRIPIHNVH